MKRLNKSTILKAIAAKTGIKDCYVDLVRSSEGYYWAGKAGACFSYSQTYDKLNDVTLERWIEDFEYRVKDTLGNSGFDNINDYIENVDWNVS